MDKGLEVLEKFCEDVNACVNSGGIHHIDMRNKDIIEKELKRLEEYDKTVPFITKKLAQKLKKEKALEIIKEKGIDIIELKLHKKAKTYNENTKRTYCEEYTDEEFDLLKEVLER